jgi:outer membrane protein assembly factor BamB
VLEVSSSVIVCSNCGARLPAPPRGATSMTCAYCGAATELAPPPPPPVQTYRAPDLVPPPSMVRPWRFVWVVPLLIAAVGAIIPFALRASKGGRAVLGEHVQFDGNHAPVVIDVDSDGIEDFAGRIRTLSPDQEYVAAYSGKTLEEVWRTPGLGATSDALGTEVAAAAGRVVVMTFRHQALVFDAKTGRQTGAIQLSDAADHACSHGQQVWVHVKDEHSVMIDPTKPSAVPAARPAWCPDADVSCRNVFTAPQAPCTSSGSIRTLAGISVSRVFWDGDTAVALGTKSPGTAVPMAVGWDKKHKREIWRLALTSSPSVQEGAPDVADLFAGRFFAVYEMHSGPRHVVAVDVASGRVLWDAAIPKSDQGSGPQDLFGTATRLYVPHWTWLDVFDAATGRVIGTVGVW